MSKNMAKLIESIYGQDSLSIALNIENIIQSGEVESHHIYWTPLLHLCCTPHTELAEILIDNGADVNTPDVSDGMTPLMCASMQHQPAMISLLLRRGANMESKNHNGWTALFYAILSKNIECVQILLQVGANTDVLDSEEETPYMLAKDMKFKEACDMIEQYKEGKG